MSLIDQFQWDASSHGWDDYGTEALLTGGVSFWTDAQAQMSDSSTYILAEQYTNFENYEYNYFHNSAPQEVWYTPYSFEQTLLQFNSGQDRWGYTGDYNAGGAADPSSVDDNLQLPPCVKNYLQQQFPEINLDNVHIHNGSMVTRVASLFATVGEEGIGGMTVGNDIYLPPGATDGDFDPNTNKGVSSLAHEITHVRQYQQAGGVVNFLTQYFTAYANNVKTQMGDTTQKIEDALNTLNDGSFDTYAMKTIAIKQLVDAINEVKNRVDLKKAYQDIPYEQEARQMENAIFADLNDRFPNGFHCTN